MTGTSPRPSGCCRAGPPTTGVRWNTYSSFACSPTNGTAWMAVQPVPIIPIRLSDSLVNPPEWSPPV